MNLQVGDQFDHFQITSYVAQGGMGDIYLAQDLLNGQEVAVKIPNRMMIGDPALYERFQREIQVMNTLDHPAIQKGLGSGQYNRTPYLVTTWVNGRTLREMVDKEAPFSPARAIAIMRKIADGMAYAHEHNVIHRDLKPENILVTDNGQPVILDFGLALTKNSHRVTYANLSATAGTPDYMAPEQIEGQRGDARTDIYALGIMLYEMLAGKPPFTGDSQMAVMNHHLHAAIPRLDKVQPAISPQLATVVTKALQKQAEDRYPTMRDFITALDHPEDVDIALLETMTGEATKVPFYRSQSFRVVVISVVIIIAVIAIALLAQMGRASG